MHSLYIHIPFCKQACHYCDFHFSTSLKYKGEMVKAICTELILRKDQATTPLHTIYLGGGTPSVLSKEELSLIFCTINKYYSVDKYAEITIEVNPDDFTPLSCNEQLSFYKSIGINRLSVGVQSFFNEHLSLMNRAHNSTDATSLLHQAKTYFDNITLDLIYAIPSMSLQQWEYNLNKALSFGIPHISAYSLTIEEKTALHHFIKQGKLPNVNDTSAYEHFFFMKDLLENEGFIHYELSNFGKEGYFSKNNTAYWTQLPYLGIGPSAHSFSGDIRRWNIAHNIKYIQSLLKGEMLFEEEILSLTDKYNERILTGLRIIRGINLIDIQNTFGDKYYNHLITEATPYLEQRLLKINNNHLCTTNKGMFLSDGIASDLLLVE